MKRKSLLKLVGAVVLAAVIAIAFVPGCAAPAPEKPTPPTEGAPAEKAKLTLFASDIGTTAYLWSATLASIVNKYSEKQQITVTPTKGYFDCMYRMIDGKGELANVSGYVTYLVLEGKAVEGREPWEGAKKIHPLYAANQHWLTAADSKYHSLRDMKGARFGTFVGGQSTMTALWLLEAAGLDPEKDLTIVRGISSDLVKSLKDGSLDVIAVGSGVPSPIIVDLCNYMDVRAIPIEEDILQEVIGRSHGGVINSGIPPGFYKGIDSFVVQPGWDNFICAKEDFPEDLVYDLSYLWATHLDEAKKANAVVEREAKKETFERPGPPTCPSSPAMIQAFKDAGII